jgi:membrane protein DedA with SNARE-associated domain
VLSHSCSYAVSIKVGPNLVDQIGGPGKTANAIDNSHRMIDGRGWVSIFGRFLMFAATMLNCRRAAHAQINDTSLR